MAGKVDTEPKDLLPGSARVGEVGMAEGNRTERLLYMFSTIVPNRSDTARSSEGLTLRQGSVRNISTAHVDDYPAMSASGTAAGSTSRSAPAA